MAYIPVAMPSEKYSNCEEWITTVFARHGLTDIEMWTTLSKIDTTDIDDISMIYIGGGNTYRLLNKLRTTGTDHLLREFVSDGGILYGGSAGAIICGETIETTPDENHVGVSNLNGLGLIPDSDVWCHYEDKAEPRKYSATSDRTVIALPERSGISATATRYKVVGYEPITVFRDGNETRYSPSEQFSL